jgi:di/tricarboxylate transporter
MSHSAALVILASCIAFAIAICAPFLYLARRRRKPKVAAASGGSRVLGKDELPTLLAFVAVMFFGFTYAYTEPETWFGRLVATSTGRLAFLVFPALVILVAREAWLKVSRSRKTLDAPRKRDDA